jgi:circadian clock protein KaiB
MKHTRVVRSSTAPRRGASAKPADEYILRLYVAGTSSRSHQAILRARQLCAEELTGQYKLEVIDIYQDPARARSEQIIATPTLVKELPRPQRRLIGTLDKSSRLCIRLGLDMLGKSGP